MSRNSMDRRLRDLERDALSGCEVARARLAQARKRSATYRAGDFVRLDRTRIAGEASIPLIHFVGNFVILAALTEPEGRTYALARLAGGTGTTFDPTHPGCSGTVTEAQLCTMHVAADAPLTWAGIANWLRCERCGAEPGKPCTTPSGVERESHQSGRADLSIPPCPTPLHHQVNANTRVNPIDHKVIAKPRVRRTRAPEIALAIPSANLDLGIFVRPRARHASHVIQPEPTPEPVEVEEYGEEWDGVEAEVDVVEDDEDDFEV